MELSLELIESSALPPPTRRDITAMCADAYSEPFDGALELLGPGVHLIGRIDGRLVTHAMWIVRELITGSGRHFRSAYVEAVATRPGEQRQGHGTTVMQRLAREIQDYDIGALSPSNEAFYQRLGWETWQGPLHIRTSGGLEPTPEESIMILRTRRTPADLRLDEALSAEWRPGEVW